MEDSLSKTQKAEQFRQESILSEHADLAGSCDLESEECHKCIKSLHSGRNVNLDGFILK